MSRLLPLPTVTDHAAHLERYGPLPTWTDDLIEDVLASGLRGRGGAGFPTGTKLAAVAAQRRSPVVVANGTEGEPTSGKDKALLRHAPHLILDGVEQSALALGARQAIVCVDRNEQDLVAILERAIDERRPVRRVGIEVRDAPDRYVAGEESALVHWLNGGDAKPTFVPPRPFERGVRGRPTMISNVETYAHIALVARYGADVVPDARHRCGTGHDPGDRHGSGSTAVRVRDARRHTDGHADRRGGRSDRRSAGRADRRLLRHVDPTRGRRLVGRGAHLPGRRRRHAWAAA